MEKTLVGALFGAIDRLGVDGLRKLEIVINEFRFPDREQTSAQPPGYGGDRPQEGRE